jgi:hypothetical protein
MTDAIFFPHFTMMSETLKPQNFIFHHVNSLTMHWAIFLSQHLKLEIHPPSLPKKMQTKV